MDQSPQIRTLDEAVTVANLRLVLNEHLSLTSAQLEELSSNEAFISLAMSKLDGADVNQAELAETKKRCITLVSSRNLAKSGSACCAIKKIEADLTTYAEVLLSS